MPPVEAPKSVWVSTKFRSACYSSIAVVLASFVAGFLAGLIPKLSSDQIVDIMKWTGLAVGANFGLAIGGSAYVDGQVQAATGRTAAQVAVAMAQGAVGQAQQAASRAQDAAVVAQGPQNPNSQPGVQS